MKLPFVESVDIYGKRVVIRVDLNVPLEDGAVVNDERIKAVLPTLQYCIERHSEVVMLSHLGRPNGKFDPQWTLFPVARHLEHLLEQPVELIRDWRKKFLSNHTTQKVQSGRVSLIENVRFEQGETQNDESLSREFARLGQAYVMDAFGTAHRAHASTCGAIRYAEVACAGPLMKLEIESLNRIFSHPNRPLVVVIGGAKVSGKLQVLHQLAQIADTVLVGGGMANTFLLANGYTVGQSLVEPDLVSVAKKLMEQSDLPLPEDVMTTKSISNECPAVWRKINDIRDNELIVDIGPITARSYAKILKKAGTILWNGPMGIFEIDQFGEGTRLLAESIATANAFTLAGGGDTISALDRNEVRESIDYVSTGGGAFLEYVEGKKLPSLVALEARLSSV